MRATIWYLNTDTSGVMAGLKCRSCGPTTYSKTIYARLCIAHIKANKNLVTSGPYARHNDSVRGPKYHIAFYECQLREIRKAKRKESVCMKTGQDETANGNKQKNWKAERKSAKDRMLRRLL